VKIVRYNVVSFRLSDEEFADLKRLSAGKKINVSEVGREALSLWLDKQKES
jgi:Arc/MetJ-type ribon-helix-helix transcriptional regulator